MCRKEIKYITVSALFRASNDGFFLVFIAVFNPFTLVSYTLTTGNALTPNIVFTSFTLVTGLRLSTIVYMVEGVLGFQQARVALRRIQVRMLHSVSMHVRMHIEWNVCVYHATYTTPLYIRMYVCMYIFRSFLTLMLNRLLLWSTPMAVVRALMEMEPSRTAMALGTPSLSYTALPMA